MDRRSEAILPTAARVTAIAGGIGLAALIGAAVIRHARRYDFAGRVVLIAGGSRGLGLILAKRLLHEGARVCICARDSRELRRAVTILGDARISIDESGDVMCAGNVMAIRCDVSDDGDVNDMVRRIETRWGPVDVLINNAGVIRVGPIETMTRDDYEYMLDVHLRGPMNTVQAVLPSMRRRGAGRIVNITSIGALLAIPHLSAYCVSKFALLGYTQSLRVELARQGITVTAICPGLMRTGSHVNAEFKGRHRREFAWFAISASLPGASENAERAAAQIIEACRYGRARVTLSIQARAAALANFAAPGLTSRLLSLVNRALPGLGGIDTAVAKGSESGSAWAPSILTRLNDRAAMRNNELNGRHWRQGGADAST